MFKKESNDSMSCLTLVTLVLLQTAAPAGCHALYFVPLGGLEIIDLS